MPRAKKTTKAKAKETSSRAPVRRKTKTRSLSARPRAPARKKGESLVRYHDRLADLVYEAERAGDLEYSEVLQRAAGKLARDEPTVRKKKRTKAKRRGPGTYPWYQCIDEQVGRYEDEKKAAAVCGRIRADSRRRYPVYWSVRGVGRRKNPTHDYALFVADDPAGWHFWVKDEKSNGLAAASSRVYRSEAAALSAAKRAARSHHERTYGTKPKAKDPTGGRRGKGRLPSILTRI
jgi:hypothetical protein